MDGTTTDGGERYIADLTRRITPTPAKCPVCDGWGKRRHPDPIPENILATVECPACKGAGVLWPPREER